MPTNEFMTRVAARIAVVAGTAWWLSGASLLYGLGGPMPIVAAAAYGVGVLVMVVLWIGARRTPGSLAPESADRALRGYIAVNLAQVAAFVGLFLTAGRFGLAAYVSSIIALIVGVHFLPLARILRWPPFRWTALGMLVAGALGCGLNLLGRPTHEVVPTVCAVSAVTLWLSAVALTHGHVPAAGVAGHRWRWTRDGRRHVHGCAKC